MFSLFGLFDGTTGVAVAADWFSDLVTARIGKWGYSVNALLPAVSFLEVNGFGFAGFV